jgi:hypothetical protein
MDVSGQFHTGERTLMPIKQEVGFGEKNLLPLPAIKPQIVQPTD